MTNEQVAVDFDVQWSGAHHGQDDDMLTPLAPSSKAATERDDDHPVSLVPRVDSAEAMQLLLSLLSERELWTLKALRVASELGSREFWVAVQMIKRRELVTSPSYGVVGLVR